MDSIIYFLAVRSNKSKRKDVVKNSEYFIREIFISDIYIFKLYISEFCTIKNFMSEKTIPKSSDSFVLEYLISESSESGSFILKSSENFIPKTTVSESFISDLQKPLSRNFFPGSPYFLRLRHFTCAGFGDWI